MQNRDAGMRDPAAPKSARNTMPCDTENQQIDTTEQDERAYFNCDCT